MGKVKGVREECLEGEKRNYVEGEMRKWDQISHWTYLNKTHIDGSRIYRDLSSIKSRKIWISRGAVKNLSMAKSPQQIEKLSRSYRSDKNFLDGSRIYRETIETNSRKFRWIENVIRSIEIKSPRGSINRKQSRICRDAVEIDKKRFFKERKNTKKWMQTSKLLNQRSNQHLKLSKSSLNKKMQSIHRSKTHTHTKQV